MTSLLELWIKVRSIVLSLFRRSFKTHSSVRVSELSQSLAFYKSLGFRRVISTRGDEVILLRNHRGDELNVVPAKTNATDQSDVSHAAFLVDDLEKDLARLQVSHPKLEIIEDAITRRLQVTDPDENVIEFYERLDRNSARRTRIYHIATQPELIAGLSQHYYVPPNEENRFVRTRARSAFLALACNRIATGAGGTPLVVEMDQSELSIESQLFDDSDIDSVRPDSKSAYPHVNSPIPRQALTGVGICERRGGDYLWPDRFVAIDTLIESAV